MGAIHLALQHEKPYDKILQAMSFGFFFGANDESGQTATDDLLFRKSLGTTFENTLVQRCGFDGTKDSRLIDELKKLWYSHHLL
jgi:hypothetical protein